MNDGWRNQISGPYKRPQGIIGIVVAQKFPDPELIRTTLEQGIERVPPETVWVMREQPRKGHAVEFAWQTFKNHDIVPLLAPLVPFWDLRPHGQDIRADRRDIEMRWTCDRIIVFHDKSSNVTTKWKEYKTNELSAATIYVVERGKVKAKRYPKRKVAR